MIIKTLHDYETLCRKYVFRGQPNKDWQLLPGTYRSDSGIQCPAMEKECVNRFIRHLQENGYRDYSSNLRQFDFLTEPSKIFPLEDRRPYWALAQHYAFDSQLSWIKTSLLDVTHNLDIAAYFAVKEEESADGIIFVFDPDTINEPYKLYEPPGGSRMEARLIVQDGAFIYREQISEHEDDYAPYKNREPFDDIVKDTIIISSKLKPLLKEYLQKKLVDLFIYPKLILGRVTPNLATAGIHTHEELREIHKPAVDRAERLGDKHSDY